MPRYYFDITDESVTADSVGNEFPSVQAARDAAIRTLPDIARDATIAGHERDVTILMRDESGRALFTASLAIKAEWLVAAA